MILQRTHRRNNDNSIRAEPCDATFDIKELFCTEVCGEAGFSDHVVCELQGGTGGRDGIAAMGNIGKGAAVDKGGGPLQRLDEIGLDGILQERSHGPFCLQIVSCDRIPVIGVGDDDPGESGLQIHQVGSETQHRHDFTGNRDIKAVFPGNTLGLPAEAVNDVAELTIVHVDSTLPGDLLRINPEGIALLNMVIKHSGQKIVGCADGMEIAGEVEIDVFHGNDLSISAAGSTALDTKDRPEGGLAKCNHGVFTDSPQTVGESHRGSGLALAGRSRCDGGDENELSLFREFPHCMQIQLGFVLAVVFHSILGNPERCRDGVDRLKGGFLGDFNVRLVCHKRASSCMK